MVKLRRVVKEAEEITPSSMDSLLLSTDTIRSITQAPDGWVELDLSGLNRRNMGYSGFIAGRNPGVYIHKDDLNRLKDSDDVINYKEIVNHSFGYSKDINGDNSLTFLPVDDTYTLFTKRVALPREIIRKLTKYKYLSSIDEYIHLEEMNWTVYSTQGNNTQRSLIIPKSVYEKKISSLDYAEYEAIYFSLRPLSTRNNFVTERKEFPITIEQLSSLIKFFYEYQNLKLEKDYDKSLASLLKKEIERCLDEDYNNPDDKNHGLEKVKEVLSIEDINMAIHGDKTAQEDVLAIFTKLPNIPVYNYIFNIYTIGQYNKFLGLMEDSASLITRPYIKGKEENRTEKDTIFIIDTRRNAKHLIGYLTKDNDTLILGAAYKENRDNNGRLVPHQIVWENGKIKDVL